MTLKFGLALMNDFPPGEDVSRRVPLLREQARAAQDAGMSSVWVLQHYLGSMPTLQPLPILAALAEDTGDMAVGTNMFILPLRHPVEVAEEFATLDAITGGRVIAGFGMGYRENEYESFGIGLDERAGRFEESVAIIRQLWSGERTTFRGQHFQIEDQRISLAPTQENGPKIWIGAGPHKVGARRAGRLGDAWIVPPHVPPAKLPRLFDHFLDEQRSHGKQASNIVVRRELLLDLDAEQAAKRGADARTRLSKQYAAYNPPQKGDAYKHLTGDQAAAEVASTSYIFDDPSGAIVKLKELEALGVTDVVLRAQWFDLPQEQVLRTLELFRDHVLPHFN
jgi:alkanesulfonate monooxygenase SsuD/methylene tetrahydromethanopterin reductase-like flavin-dependent oxidoreductase (luciferase family)